MTKYPRYLASALKLMPVSDSDAPHGSLTCDGVGEMGDSQRSVAACELC